MKNILISFFFLAIITGLFLVYRTDTSNGLYKKSNLQDAKINQADTKGSDAHNVLPLNVKAPNEMLDSSEISLKSQARKFVSGVYISDDALFEESEKGNYRYFKWYPVGEKDANGLLTGPEFYVIATYDTKAHKFVEIILPP